MKATILVGDVLARLADIESGSIQCVTTSPPYWGLRSYGIPPTQWPEITFEILPGFGSITIPAMDCCLGLESTPNALIGHCVEVFRGVKRALADDGVCWVNFGDSYAGSWGAQSRGNSASELTTGLEGTWARSIKSHPLGITAVGSVKNTPGIKPKDLTGIPWMFAFALRADGWFLRQDCIWSKPAPMPESVTDRCTKSHEYLFLLTKSQRYYWDQDAILEPCSDSTHARPSQDIENQIGSARANGGEKTNGNMKAVARHLPRNKTHKGTTAYENGDERQRTKAGLVDYATRMRDNYKGSIPGRKDGPGQDRRQPELRLLGEKGQQADPSEVRSAKGAAFGRGAGWRKLAEEGSGTKNNVSFDAAMAVMPEKRNKRSVWTINTQPYSEAHFATYPEALVEPCILAGSKEGDTVLDPFCGSGTTGIVALRYRRNFIGIELNPEYAKLAETRINGEAPLLNTVEVLA